MECHPEQAKCLIQDLMVINGNNKILMSIFFGSK